MSVPCEACGKPVHEQAVKCPHCGELSGVPVDPVAAAAIEAMPVLRELPSAPLPIWPDAGHSLHVPNEGEILVAQAIVSGVARVVDAAIELVKPDDPDDDPLPRAIARPHKKSNS